jgi:hypothetical protein
MKFISAVIMAMVSVSVFAEEVPIVGNVESKCVITTDTAGIYGNPTPSNLSTDPTDGGVTPIVRYDISMAEYYKAVIRWPDEFSQSPDLNDTLQFSGEVTVDRVSASEMSDYESEKVEYENATEFGLTESGSTWFAIESEVDYGFNKALPGGTYRSLVSAECIAQ